MLRLLTYLNNKCKKYIAQNLSYKVDLTGNLKMCHGVQVKWIYSYLAQDFSIDSHYETNFCTWIYDQMVV